MTTKLTPAEVRREKAHARLGTRSPACLGCGYDKDPCALELAHLAPRRFHQDVGILCRNCHRIQSDAEKDFTYSPSTLNPALETIARYLMGLSEFLVLIAATLKNFGSQLLEMAQRGFDPQAEQPQ